MTSDTTSDLEVQPRQRLSRRSSIVIVVVLLLVALLLPLGWLWLRSSVVPNVVGMTQTAARKTIVAAGFRVGIEGEILADNVAPGLIAKQNPPAGKRVAKGAKIDIDRASEAMDATPPLSTDPGLKLPLRDRPAEVEEEFVEQPLASSRTVPSVHGMSKADAIAILKRQGYRVRLKYGSSTTDVRKGRVFFQDPAPHTEAQGANRVDVWVSTGPPKTGQYRPPRPQTRY